MSRKINIEDGIENLSADDIQYLKDRGRLPDDAVAYEPEDSAEDSTEDEGEDNRALYEGMSKKELVSLIEGRNEDREEDDHVSKSGNKEALVEALLEDDAFEDDEDEEEDEG